MVDITLILLVMNVTELAKHHVVTVQIGKATCTAKCTNGKIICTKCNGTNKVTCDGTFFGSTQGSLTAYNEITCVQCPKIINAGSTYWLPVKRCSRNLLLHVQVVGGIQSCSEICANKYWVFYQDGKEPCDEKIQCLNCSDGLTICDSCGGSGVVECHKCFGAGKLYHGLCGGSGKLKSTVRCVHGYEPNYAHYFCNTHGNVQLQYH